MNNIRSRQKGPTTATGPSDNSEITEYKFLRYFWIHRGSNIKANLIQIKIELRTSSKQLQNRERNYQINQQRQGPICVRNAADSVNRGSRKENKKVCWGKPKTEEGKQRAKGAQSKHKSSVWYAQIEKPRMGKLWEMQRVRAETEYRES